MIESRAAVLWSGADRLSVEDVLLEQPREDEVLVRIVASGICHTDMVLRDAGMTTRPVVLGHEGSGIVERTGRAVTGLRAGDRVAMSFSSCGQCPSCRQHAPAYCRHFFPLNFAGRRTDGTTSMRKDDRTVGSHVFGQSSFATHAVCPATNLVKVDDAIPLEIAGPFGCGFQTGAGAVLNSLKVSAGSSVMVLGAGAVGLSAVMAAAYIAEAFTVIAVDLNDARLGVAREVGASHALDGGRSDFADAVRAVCPDGVDYVIDTTGYIPAVEPCLELLASRGTLGLVASYPLGKRFSFDAVNLMTSGKKIQGIMEGDTDIQQFIPSLLEHYQQGRFPVDRLVRYYDFADINQAIADAESGKTIKAIVTMA